MLSDLSEVEISRKLASALEKTGETASPEYPGIPQDFFISPTSAAVLMPLFKKTNLWHLLFIRRTVDQHEHSNQVAFPGGHTDPQDTSPEQTALREASEEIGLQPVDVTVLGQLRGFLTVTHYCVTPVVGVIPWPYPFHLAKREVSRIFTIPLAWLDDPANYEVREHTLPASSNKMPVVYFCPYDGEVLWGASARFTLALLEILKS
jgi:8-oxo-dGTP pyrophosphatase MutT (NUDIX family)